MNNTGVVKTYSADELYRQLNSFPSGPVIPPFFAEVLPLLKGMAGGKEVTGFYYANDKGRDVYRVGYRGRVPINLQVCAPPPGDPSSCTNGLSARGGDYIGKHPDFERVSEVPVGDFGYIRGSTSTLDIGGGAIIRAGEAYLTFVKGRVAVFIDNAGGPPGGITAAQLVEIAQFVDRLIAR